MSRLSDATLEHLRRVLEWPEVPGDRYEAVAVLGQGGMATVYRAHDRGLGREVALKVLRPETSTPALADRLRREARILARLEHPGIVPLHDAGTLADGRVYYIMKLVRGVRLDLYAGSAARSEALRVFLRVCDAVGFAHAQGIIHRDLKPANIMVGAFGEVLVLDWGIARVLDESEPPRADIRADAPAEMSGDTAVGMVLGTPGFMAPEQAQGEVHHVDARTDIYALGAILKGIVGVDEAPKPLRAIWERASAPIPDQRYQTAAELAGGHREAPRGAAGDRVPREPLRTGGPHLCPLPNPDHPGTDLPRPAAALPGDSGALKAGALAGNRIQATRTLPGHPHPCMEAFSMSKPLLGLILGGVLGALDGLTALVSAPEVAPQIVGIVIGSMGKGLVAGLLIGWIARKLNIAAAWDR